MAFSLSRQAPGVTGLDIDGGYLAAAVVDRGSIDKLVSMELPPGVAGDGEVTDPQALTFAVKDMFDRFKLPRRVRLGVANQQIVVRQLELPVIADEGERDAAIRFQAAEAIAMPLEDAVLDYQVIGAREVDGNPRQTVLVVAARSSMVARLVDAVKAAGLKPEGLDLSAFALIRVLGDANGNDHDHEQSARVFCHLGGVTNCAIAAGPMCLFARTLQTVWSAEEQATADSLAEELRLSIDYYGTQPSARALDSVVLSGPGADDPALHEAIAARTNLSASLAPALGRLGTDAVPPLDDASRYTVAAGLALGEYA